MQSAVFRALEFDRIREALAREAATPLGRERALTLDPATDLDEVRRRLSMSAAAASFEKSGSLAIDGPEDLAEVLDHLGIADQPLAPLQLLGLARFVSSVGSVVDRVRDATTPLLAELVTGVRQFDEEVNAVRRAVQPSGDIDDNASTALRDIRDSLRRQRSKLRSTLDGLVRGRDTSKYLQDQIVSDRNGRYVIVVRAEHRDAIPGIVHGASTSGASLYLEPMATVSLNNEVVALAEREKAEVHRILLALTDAFRGRPDDLDALLAAAADLDELHAKAQFAARVDGVAPELTSEGHLEFRGARHPLLIPSVRELLRGNDGLARHRSESEGGTSGPSQVIASNLLVSPPARALVISGPNTGGKTVALKAFGLLAVMAQAGILIPVEPGSRLTPLRTVFADIGDEQSISASLSTFSAHIANLVAFERDLQLPALVLLDEVGSGTDPVEGGALGAAVIDHFRKRGAIVIATTHDDALKSYGATTEGVAVAAFGFNAETFAPTYALVYGAPGRSLALEVARRLGMPAEVVADAERRRSGRESLLAAHLARVDQELSAVEQEKRHLRDQQAALDTQRRSLLDRETRLSEREAVLKKRLDDKLTERLREARAEVDAVVTRLKTKADALVERVEKRGAGLPALSTGEVGSLRAEARAALGDIETSTLGAQTGQPVASALDEPPSPGDRVWIPSFSAEAIVRGINGQQVDVEVRGKRMRVQLSALRKPGKGSAAANDGASGARKTRVPTAATTSTSLAAHTRDLVLIGSTVDDAVPRVEKALDDAIVADERRLRIVHGHGTGRLRDALRSFARQHPLVASVAPAADNEGGDGATIVELKD